MRDGMRWGRIQSRTKSGKKRKEEKTRPNPQYNWIWLRWLVWQQPPQQQQQRDIGVVVVVGGGGNDDTRGNIIQKLAPAAVASSSKLTLGLGCVVPVCTLWPCAAQPSAKSSLGRVVYCTSQEVE